MEYRRFKDKIIFRLETGDELMSSIEKIAAEMNVNHATINGIGACSRIEMGYIVLSKKEYVFKSFEGNLEILQTTGNITMKDSKPFAHIHINVADEECRSFGGHVKNATISATFEGVMHIIDTAIHREINTDVGIALMNVCGMK